MIPNVATSGGITAASFAGVDAWMRWLPPGLAAHAIQDASTGHPGTALARLALLAAVIIVLGWLWVRSLGRALVTADTSTGSSQLRGTALPLARYGLRGAVAARTWIYQRREPTSLVYWAMTAVIMGVVSASTILGSHQHPAVVIASAVIGAGFVCYFHANSIGLAGPPFLIEALALTSRRSLRAYFAGQNIALGVIAAPLLTAICWGLAAGVRNPAQGVPATAVALAGLGAALGLANILTVTFAYPMATRAGSPMRQAAQGYGAYTFGGILASLAGVAVAVTPVILAAAFTSTAPAAVRTPALIICSAAYGLALAWAGVQIAARQAQGRLPELCQIAVQGTIKRNSTVSGRHVCPEPPEVEAEPRVKSGVTVGGQRDDAAALLAAHPAAPRELGGQRGTEAAGEMMPPLGPVHARPQQRPGAAGHTSDIDIDLGEHPRARCAEHPGAVLLADRISCGEALGDGDPGDARQVVVAHPRPAQVAHAGRAAQRPDRPRGRQQQQRLQGLGHLLGRE